jgi:hypothetical protein
MNSALMRTGRAAAGRLGVVVALGSAVMVGSCVEVAEPELPERRAPAILQANMRIFDAGVFQVDGSLTPGREETGFLRVVQVPFIQAGPFTVAPTELTRAGVRTYQESFAVPRNATAGPFDLIPPDVRGTPTLPPVRWYGLQRIGSDTLRVVPGGDIVLRVDTIAAPSQPATRFRQWFLEVRTGSTTYRISGDQPPPPVLRIPAEFAPGMLGGQSTVSMIYLQSAQLRTPDGSYIANVMLDTRLNWTVLYRNPPP